MYQREAENPLYDPNFAYSGEAAAPMRERAVKRDAMDCSDIPGAKSKSKIRPMGRPPVHSQTVNRQTEQPRRMVDAGFNIISHQPHSSSSQHRPVMSHQDAEEIYSQAALAPSQVAQSQYDHPSQMAPSQVAPSQAGSQHPRANRSLDVRDICGPKKSHYGRRATGMQDPNVFAGMRRGAADAVSAHGGNFIKPDKNHSSAFSHLDMSQENYNAMLMAKQGDRKQIPKNRAREDPSAMVIAGMAKAPEPFAVQDLMVQHRYATRENSNKRQRQELQEQQYELPAEPQRSNRIMMEAPRAPLREIQAAPKTTSLNEGYSRLFGSQEPLPLTMGDRPKGKAQVNNGRPAEQGIW